MIGQDIEALIKIFSKLPGLGPRSARRIILHLLTHKEKVSSPLIHSLEQVRKNITDCSICGNFDTQDPCSICSDKKRSATHICIVESVSDLWAIERSSSFHGKYHVLGGTLSAIDNIGPEELGIPNLQKRIKKENIQEITLALNATIEGQTTLHYLVSELQQPHLKISTIAQGVPLGGELDYLDAGTITTAFSDRRTVDYHQK